MACVGGSCSHAGQSRGVALGACASEGRHPQMTMREKHPSWRILRSLTQSVDLAVLALSCGSPSLWSHFTDRFIFNPFLKGIQLRRT